MNVGKQLDHSEKHLGRVFSWPSPDSQTCFFLRIVYAVVCNCVKITLLDVILPLLSTSRRIQRVVLFKYVSHTIYMSSSFSLVTIIKLMKAGVWVCEPRRRHFNFASLCKADTIQMYGLDIPQQPKLYLVLDLVWYAQRRRTFRLERNPDFSCCAMLLNAQMSGILAATQKLAYDFVAHTTPRVVYSRPFRPCIVVQNLGLILI